MADYAFGIIQAQELDRGGRAAFDELCDLLSDATGTRFRPVVAPTYRDLAASLERGEAGLAWLPPIVTIELEARQIATVLAIPARNGLTSYHAALIVRRGGPRTVADLRACRAAWTERSSSSGYLVPRMQLAAQGIDVLRYFARELFVLSHSAVVDAVVQGEADVGATYCHFEAAAPRSIDRGSQPDIGRRDSAPPGRIVRGPWLDDDGRALRPLEVLTTFGPIPNDALVGSNGLSAAARSGLARWLLDPSPRARELFTLLLGSGDFRVPSPAHYDPLRHMMRTARARGHDAPPPSSRTGIRVARRQI